jgi:hypothetical protein
LIKKELNIKLVSIREFCENQHREDHTLLTGINEITFTRVPTFFIAYPLTLAALHPSSFG